ncbi:MAG: ribosome maturation factor RimM [Eubacteriales bacterium]
MEEFLEIGRITNVHGLAGEVKVEVWADSPDFLRNFKTLYLGNQKEPIGVQSMRTHKKMGIVKLEGLIDVDSGMTVRGRTVFVKRAEAPLPEGHFFLVDVIGLEVRDSESGTVLGKVADILYLPAHNVYVVRGGEREIMVPAVPAFVVETDVAQGFMRVNMLEGL